MTSASTRLSRISIATGAALAVAFTAAIAAAGPAYLKIGDIKGESTEKAQERRIEIHSWSWGASQASEGKSKSKGKVEYSWKVEEGEKAPPPPGEAEITLKNADEASRGVSDVTLKRGTMAESTSALPTGKRQHKPFATGRPAGMGSLTAVIPAGICQAGARYPAAELGTGDRVYRMRGVVVTACTAGSGGSSGDDMPTETISLNYEEIE